MMNFRKIVMALALALSGLAAADIVTVVDAVETVATNVIVPTSTNGRLLFRPCADNCDDPYRSVRLTPETRFVVRGQSMNFVDFRKYFYNLRSRGETYTLISYETSSKIVTSVNLGL